MKKLVVVPLVLLGLMGCGGGSSSEGAGRSSSQLPQERNVAFGLSYPGVTDAEEREFTRVNLQALSLSHIRFDEAWMYREPTEGEYHWGPLDERMHWAAENDVSVLLTLQSNGPDWACDPDLSNERTCVFRDIEKFETYIHALFTRYPNQIDKVQFGNEWLAPYWFLGSADDFVAYNNVVYQAVQQHSPETRVVLGGFASGSLSIMAYCAEALDQYFDEQSGELVALDQRNDVCQSEQVISRQQMLETVLAFADFDYIDLHLYDDVENWPVYFSVMGDAVGDVAGDTVPVLVGEFGGPNLLWEQPYSDAFQAERLEQYLHTLSNMDIEEAYYFKLVQSESALAAHWESGLYKQEEGVYVQKPAFTTFEQFMKGYAK